MQGKSSSKAAKEEFDSYDVDSKGYLNKDDLKKVSTKYISRLYS